MRNKLDLSKGGFQFSGAGMFTFMMFTAFLKLWLWNQMDKHSILREMKRIEFQVALLMEKIQAR